MGRRAAWSTCIARASIRGRHRGRIRVRRRPTRQRQHSEVGTQPGRFVSLRPALRRPVCAYARADRLLCLVLLPCWPAGGYETFGFAIGRLASLQPQAHADAQAHAHADTPCFARLPTCPPAQIQPSSQPFVIAPTPRLPCLGGRRLIWQHTVRFCRRRAFQDSRETPHAHAPKAVRRSQVAAKSSSATTASTAKTTKTRSLEQQLNHAQIGTIPRSGPEDDEQRITDHGRRAFDTQPT